MTLPPFLATGIGSMPFADAVEAVDLALASLPECPMWPQLPKRDLNEQMEIQYSEGIPRVVIDREKGRMYFDTSGDYSEELAEFYETYLTAMDPDEGTGDCSALAISEDFSAAIPELLRRCRTQNNPLPFIKVQTTGPCSFALTVVDQDKRAVYYNEEFRDIIIKALAMKCRWQIRRFAKHAGSVVCFIDEPILSAFGSSTYVSVKRDDVVAHLREVIDAVHADKALAGVHCCGNTEWSILIDAGVDIVNFDAWEFGETIAMYPDQVRAHLQRGGYLAWGAVPTSMAIREAGVPDLAARLEKNIDILAAKGIDRDLICRQAVLTPSCGTGSMEVEDARKVFDLLGRLSGAMREKYGG